MVANIFMGMILILIGGVMFIGSALNLRLFFSMKRVEKAVNFFGKTGARVFYIIFGSLIIAVGVAGTFGIFDNIKFF